MRFHKLFWPTIFSSLVLCIVMLSFSIVSTILRVPPPTVNTNPSITTKEDSFQNTTITLPIIMYHALIKDPKAQNKYFISPDILKNDLKYLAANGYTAITMTELINYVYNDTPLPEKPIILTFDDGFYNNYVYAYPLLKEYNQKAVISIIGSLTDRDSLLKDSSAYYSYLTWEQVKEMSMSGLIEIQNHTYDMHTYENGRKGCADKKGEDFDTYKEIFIKDIGLLQQRITDYTNITPNTMVYPFGYYTNNSEILIKEMGFKASLTCCQKLNNISHDPTCLYKLGRFLRPPEKNSADFFEGILNNNKN